LPAALQREVHAIVEQTRVRSGWAATRTLVALGVSRRSYYRWLKTESWTKTSAPPRPVQPYEALASEKQAVLDYARRRPELRHREMAWRMVDEDVVCLSASTIYRILKEAGLVCPWRRRLKRSRLASEKPSRPNERWVTDLMQVVIAGGVYYLISFMDEYSRYIVHHELVLGMDGITVSAAAQAAIDTLPKDANGRPVAKPVIQSDNGSGYIAKEFRVVLSENGLGHHRIKPHCPEENGTMERLYRTVRDHLEEVELTSLHQARAVLARMVAWYNGERLHSALGYLPPQIFYAGDPQACFEMRRRKMSAARQRRRCANLGEHQQRLPFPDEETVSNT
jgi:putative transposase